MVKLTKKNIVAAMLLQSVQANRYGGVVFFLGVVRGNSSTKIEYSSYDPMALKKLRQIEQEILKRWKNRGIGKIEIAHRLGNLKVGQISVGIAVSAIHRKEAFEACRYAIDKIKKTVPIFKKEFYGKGKSRWVGC